MRYALIAFALASLTACASKAPSPGLGDPYPPPGNDPQVTVLSKTLQDWLAFQPAIVVHHDDGTPMHVQVPVRNMGTRKYLVQYRFTFYDVNDMQLQPLWGWERANLYPKEMVRVTSTAPNADAVNYRLEIKWAE